jgi:hypothetical protein
MRPGIAHLLDGYLTNYLPASNHILQSAKKVFTILPAAEYRYPVNPPAHYMMQGAGRVQSGLSGHNN